MYEHEYAVETPVARDAIWAVFSDVDRWTQWDTSMEKVAFDGPMQTGTVFRMTPVGQEEITSRLVDVRAGELSVDRTEFAGLTLTFTHRFDPLPGGGTRVAFRVEIDGAGVDGAPGVRTVETEIGPAITADFPDAVNALIALAAAR
jgi:hypothetical protein